MIVVINKNRKKCYTYKQIFNIFLQPADVCCEWLLESEKMILLIGPNENY